MSGTGQSVGSFRRPPPVFMSDQSHFLQLGALVVSGFRTNQNNSCLGCYKQVEQYQVLSKATPNLCYVCCILTRRNDVSFRGSADKGIRVWAIGGWTNRISVWPLSLSKCDHIHPPRKGACRGLKWEKIYGMQVARPFLVVFPLDHSKGWGHLAGLNNRLTSTL